MGLQVWHGVDRIGEVVLSVVIGRGDCGEAMVIWGLIDGEAVRGLWNGYGKEQGIIDDCSLQGLLLRSGKDDLKKRKR
ncbi:hypothetical protein M0R45_009278 [Rubus argutus]|uniref:Uncharacterized protein n=1 Tax=Rubus argutus TaxID=59490 RepID=A0AAW1Y4D4_RUBAR